MMGLCLVHGAPDDPLLSLHSEALMTPLRQRMIEDMQIRNLSPSTIETYTYHVGRFAQYFNRSPAQLGAEQIRQFQVHLVCEKKVSWSTFKGNKQRLSPMSPRLLETLRQYWIEAQQGTSNCRQPGKLIVATQCVPRCTSFLGRPTIGL